MENTFLILLAEDDGRLSLSLESALTQFASQWYGVKWVFIRTETASEALKAIKTHNFDAVITDWRLDEHDRRQNGVAIIQAAREKDLHCVRILFSAYPLEFDRYRDAYANGAFDVIAKSAAGTVFAKELAQKMNAALERRQANLLSNAFARHIDHMLRQKYGRSLENRDLKRKWLTVVFTDIRGFSKAADKLKAQPKFLSDFVCQICSKIVECSHNHGGIVDKFIGDGSMLLFGALDNTDALNPKDAIRAVKAAIEIRAECEKIIQKFNADAGYFSAVDMPELRMGIGINRDEVLVGLVQTEHRDQFTALGHGVNLAQRLESHACKLYSSTNGTYGDILISRTVHACVQNQFKLKSEPKLEAIKNIDDSHPVWSVIR